MAYLDDPHAPVATAYAVVVRTLLSPVNVGGGSPVPIREALRLIEQVTGRKLVLEHLPAAQGDMPITRASTERLQRELGFLPATPLIDGLRRQWEWIAAGGGSGK